MKILILKIIGFALANLLIALLALECFRTIFPQLGFLTVLLHLIGLICFPYIKAFNINQLNKKENEKNS